MIQRQWQQDLSVELDYAVNTIRRCAEADVDLVCFTELSFRPWFVAERPSEGITALPLPEIAHATLLEAANKYGVCVNYSDIEHSDSIPFNANKFVEPSGKIFTSYKRHVPDLPGFYEASWFRTTEEPIKAFETSIGTIGLLLCTDVMFPEEAQSLGQQGVDLILAPRSASYAFVSRWLNMISANATVSGAFVVSINRIGNDGGVNFSGNSCIADPGGELSSLMGQGDAMMLVNLDLSRAKTAKGEYPLKLN